MALNYGLCKDRFCDEPEEPTDLFHGVCAGCLEANNDEGEFRSANEADMREIGWFACLSLELAARACR